MPPIKNGAVKESLNRKPIKIDDNIPAPIIKKHKKFYIVIF